MRTTVSRMSLIGLYLVSLPGLQASVPGTFRISATPATNQKPAVVSDGTGNTVVLWQERTPGRILARRYDAMRGPVGPAFRVNSLQGGVTTAPVAAMDAGGGLAAVWIQSIGNRTRLFLRLFDPTATPLGPQIEIADVREVQGWAVARADNGDVCVTWSARESGKHSSVFIRTFDALGAPLSAPVELGVGGMGTSIDDHGSPAVAAGADGKFFVVWVHSIGPESVLLGQLVDRNAVPAGERFSVAEQGLFELQSPSVSPGTEAGVLVSWFLDDSEPEGVARFIVRPYDGQGQALGDAREIDRDPSAGSVAMAADGRGGFLAVWQSLSASGDNVVYGQHLDSAGVPLGERFLVVAPDPAFHFGLDLAATSGGDVLVVLNRDFEILGRRLAAELPGGTFHLTRRPTELEAVGIGENGFTAGLGSTVSVWRTGGASGQFTLGYRTLDGSATAGLDYAPLDGTVTFQAGDVRADVELEVLDDLLFEGDEDFFFLLDDGGAGRLIAPSSLRVDVLDDDFAPPSGGPAPVGPAVPVTGGDEGERISPSLAATGGEGVVMAWVEKGLTSDLDQVRAARFGGDGRLAGEIMEVGLGDEPSVASGPGGDVSVAWNTGSEILWRRFDSSGRPLGEPVVVAEIAFPPGGGGAVPVSRPRIARLADGGDAVVWLRQFIGSATVSESIRLRKLDARGEPASDVTLVGSVDFAPVGHYALAADADGSLLVASSRQDGTFVQRFDADMRPLGDGALLSASAPLGGVDLAIGPGGTFTVVWDEPQTSGFWKDVMGRRMARDLTPLGPAFRVSRSTAKSQEAPRVAADAEGNLLVVWQSEDQDGSGSGVFGQRFDAQGRRIGGEFLVNDAVAGDQTGPQTVIDTSGRVFVAWASERTGAADILLRTFQSSMCVAGDERLCLQQDRFAVEVTWRDFEGRTGPGRTRPMTSDTGTFWFFGENNLELMVKVLDGTGINGHYWVFFGSLTNVEFTLTVTDTATGVSRRYVNPSGHFASRGDVMAFPGGAI